MACCLFRVKRFQSYISFQLIYTNYVRSKRLFHPQLFYRGCRWQGWYGAPILSPQEVTGLLRANETSEDLKYGSVRAFDTCQLGSNNPVEDRISGGRCLLTTGLLFGVFDGHGGYYCSELVSQRLLDYIALSILPLHLLQEFVESVSTKSLSLVETFNHLTLTEEQQSCHSSSLLRFANKLLDANCYNSDFFMQEAMIRAFSQLDEDISQQIQEGAIENNLDLLSLAVTGSCACVAHIDGPHLHIATSGDCRAVLGVLEDDNKWISKPLTTDHNSDNLQELKRIVSEHPRSEANVVIKNERLLGQLAPLRAFGDFTYKWETSLLKELLVPVFGEAVIPPNYHTPPYLTASPEVIHHRLTSRDKFLVIASDGLWEQMMHFKVIKFVGQHMSGKQTFHRLKLPRKDMALKDINDILLQRRWGLGKKPIDTNAATHLIRNALGRAEYGIEHIKLSAMLSLPEDIVRNFRDDISITVIYFDSDFLSQSSAL